MHDQGRLGRALRHGRKRLSGRLKAAYYNGSLGNASYLKLLESGLYELFLLLYNGF